MVNFLKRDKRIIYYVKLITGSYTVVKRRILKWNEVLVKVNWKNKTYLFDMNDAIFRNKNKVFYIVDIDDGQLTLNKKKMNVSPQLLKATFTTEIAQQLVSATEDYPFKEKIIFIILGIIVGIMGGYIIGNLVPMV